MTATDKSGLLGDVKLALQRADYATLSGLMPDLAKTGLLRARDPATLRNYLHELATVANDQNANYTDTPATPNNTKRMMEIVNLFARYEAPVPQEHKLVNQRGIEGLTPFDIAVVTNIELAGQFVLMGVPIARADAVANKLEMSSKRKADADLLRHYISLRKANEMAMRLARRPNAPKRQRRHA